MSSWILDLSDDTYDQLVTGAKRGNWRAWYPPATALADQRLDDWLSDMKGGT